MNIRLREVMKKSGITVTDLATYLDVSRPTIYSFITMYESDQQSKLEKRVFDFFEFMVHSDELTTVVIVDYLLKSGLNDSISESSLVNKMSTLASSLRDVDQKKYKLIKHLLEVDLKDIVIDTLYDNIFNSSVSSVSSVKTLKGKSRKANYTKEVK